MLQRMGGFVKKVLGPKGPDNKVTGPQSNVPDNSDREAKFNALELSSLLRQRSDINNELDALSKNIRETALYDSDEEFGAFLETEPLKKRRELYAKLAELKTKIDALP